MLQELGFNNGERISEEFFRSNIAGRHNPDIMADLFPVWSKEEQTRFSEDKEARFRSLAGCHVLLLPFLVPPTPTILAD